MTNTKDTAARAIQYRARAEELRTIAANLKGEEARATLTSLADSYCAMARECEADLPPRKT
jgi:hypothetical protein